MTASSGTTTGNTRPCFVWNVTNYAYVIWFHVFPVRVWVVSLCLMVIASSPIFGTIALTCLGLTLLDVVVATILHRQRSGFTDSYCFADSWGIPGKILWFMDGAGWVATAICVPWALWIHVPGSINLIVGWFLVGVALAGVIASIPRQLRTPVPPLRRG